MQGRFAFLGTSGSMGVPVVGCKCSVCSSTSPYNKRRRCAALITLLDRHFLIDAGPEIRQQLIETGIHTLDGALITHPHFDHIAGFDDLKGFYFAEKKKLPILLSQPSYEEMKLRYHYLMDAKTARPEWIHFDFQVLDNHFGKTRFAGMEFEYVSFTQTKMLVTGIKMGNLAYLSDLKEYTEELVKSIYGIDILIVSALRQTSSPMHFSIDEAIAFSKEVNAKKTFFTHLAHDVDYERDSKRLPPTFSFAYDGLEIPFHYEGQLS